MHHEMAPRSAPPEPPHDPSGGVRRHVVVDGSNIATEGHDAPSLAQLDEAVQAFMREFGPEIVTVVVDATFPNRIARSERNVYEAAVVAGEIITPPAGAIGRGDAFILQIADRADATILSNDSFQEFHGQYDWLFDPGRLVGGKPVPHVGWVFIDRTPVRGPLSRRSVSAAKRAAEEGTAPKAIKAIKVDKAAKKVPVKKRPVAKEAAAKAPARAAAKAPATKATPAPAPTPAPSPSPAKVPASTPTKRITVAATGPPRAPAVGSPAPANDALPFIEFVGAHPVGSLVEAVVEQFSSHGAYARVGPVQAYVPLKYLANPAPRSAKKILRVGETRNFVVVAVDPTRRGIDLALPGVDLTSPDDPAVAPASIAASASVEVVEPPPAPAKPARSRRGGAAKSAGATKAATPRTAKEPASGDQPAPPQKAAKATRSRKAGSRKAAEKGAQDSAQKPAQKATPKKSAKKAAAAKRSVG